MIYFVKMVQYKILKKIILMIFLTMEIYFEHFILDLELQIGNSKDGQLAISNLKTNLQKCIEQIKKAKDFIPFDYEIFKTAMFALIY
jgi:hypothetical protein